MSKINPFKNSSFREERPRRDDDEMSRRNDDRPRRDDEMPRRNDDRPRRNDDRPRRNDDRPRRNDDRYRRDDDRGKYFSFSENKPKDKEIKTFSLEDTELFPELASLNLNLNKEQKDEPSPSSISFLNALNTFKEEIEDTNKIHPGWISMSFDANRNINVQCADEKTENEIKREQLEKDLEDPNLIMEKVIDVLSKSWQKHINEYDSIHGEGAYDNVHYMEPMIFPYEDENENGETGDEDNYDDAYDEYDDYYNDQ